MYNNNYLLKKNATNTAANEITIKFQLTSEIRQTVLALISSNGYYCHNMSAVCLSSVMRVYCDKTAKVMIMQFSLKCSRMP